MKYLKLYKPWHCSIFWEHSSNYTMSTTPWIKNEVITHKGQVRILAIEKLICSHFGFTLKILLCTVNYKIVHGVRAFGMRECYEHSGPSLVIWKLQEGYVSQTDCLIGHLCKLHSLHVGPPFSSHFPRLFFSRLWYTVFSLFLFIVLNYTRKTSN